MPPQNKVEVGYSNHTAGANGLINKADVIGNPNITCLEANTFSTTCVLLENDADTGFVTKVWAMTGTTASPAWTPVATDQGKNNMTAVTDPTVTDDSSKGYSVGSMWLNTLSGALFVASDVTVGAAVWNVVDSSGAVHVAQITLKQADILALNTTPKQIVAATGVSNQVITPIAALMAYTFNTAAFATNTELDLIHDTSSIALMKQDISQGASAFLNFNPVSAASGTQFIANKDLNAFVPTGNPTGGGVPSQIIITVLYVIASAI